MNINKEFDIVIIGGGPAGLAAAASAKAEGVGEILIIDRGFAPGGILLQCAHKGFGRREYGEALTGQDYARRSYAKIEHSEGITLWLDTVVLSVSRDKEISCVSPDQGFQRARGKKIILALGCREQSRGAIRVPGDRLAGIMTAGVAQRMINVFNFLPGKKAVLLGTGDIGFVTAAELVEAGCEVAAIVERYARPKAKAEHIDVCVNTLHIPLYLGHTLTNIQGEGRVQRVTVAKVDADLQPVSGTEFELECDTVILSVGFRPEHNLTDTLGLACDPVLGGVLVDEAGRTSLPDFYGAGNVVTIFDDVDDMVAQAQAVGRGVARDLLGK